MDLVQELMDEKSFLILNAYSLGFSAMIVENMLKHKSIANLQTGELYLHARTGLKLPLGVFGRAKNF